MNVRDLITELQSHDLDATVVIANERGYGWDRDVEQVTASTRQIGILLPTPTTERVVILGSGSEGL